MAEFWREYVRIYFHITDISNDAKISNIEKQLQILKALIIKTQTNINKFWNLVTNSVYKHF